MREGFRLIQAFAVLAARQRDADFQIAQASLADRLSITPQGAGGVIRRLMELNVIERSQEYKPHQSPARYRWLKASDPPAPHEIKAPVTE